YQKDGKIVYAIIDCESIGKGPAPLPVYLGAVGTDADGKAKITQVLPDSPAAKAGLAVGDFVTSIGEKEITGFDQALDALRDKKVRDKVTIQITRGGEKKSLEAALAARPTTGGPGPGGGGGGGGSGAGQAFSRVWMGVTGADREGKATLVQVIPDGPA